MKTTTARVPHPLDAVVNEAELLTLDLARVAPERKARRLDESALSSGSVAVIAVVYESSITSGLTDVSALRGGVFDGRVA